METYQTEEEQLEALKKWWRENSRSTFLAVALALGAGFGWQGWQDHRKEQAESASAVYEEMLQAAGAAAGEGATDEQKATARHLATSLKADYPGSSYAVFAALHLAKLAVEEDKLAEAEEELRWVLTQGTAPEIELVAQLRLARVQAAQGELDAALKMVSIDDAGAYAASYAEAEGDIQLALGNEASARTAYERAVALQAGDASVGAIVQVKLKALTPVPAREITVVAEEVLVDEQGDIVEEAVLVEESSVEAGAVQDPGVEVEQ